MKTFIDFLTNRLDEKLIMFNQGKNYGQIVIMSGGSGSGKGFVIKNFIETNKFKKIDVDAWKEAFLTLNKLKGQYPELKGLSLGVPADVYKLHVFVKEKKIKEKTLSLLFGNDVPKPDERLPNILFDITGKDVEDIEDITKISVDAGYTPENIHLVYVLTDWKTAYQNNLRRTRVVPAEVFLETHRGATQTLKKIINGAIPTSMLDGSINIVLNNRENTIFYKGTKVVKEFDYLNLKKEGQPIKSDSELLDTMNSWLEQNAPRSALKEK